MQGGESLWTVEECLRGRLVAERVASKTANDNAELLDLKLKELEKQLKIETKFRKKAEKKLNLLKKKLESLNISISVFSEESQQSISSDRSCISSIASNSSSINQQDQCLLTPEVSNSNSVTSVVTDKVDLDIHLLPQMTDIHDSGRKNDNSSTLEPQLLENHDGSKSLSLLYKNSNEDIHQKNDADSTDNVNNNLMALVVIDPVVECNDDSCNQVSEVTDDAVREVLFTLKQIKQNIQCRLKSRGVIKGC